MNKLQAQFIREFLLAVMPFIYALNPAPAVQGANIAKALRLNPRLIVRVK